MTTARQVEARLSLFAIVLALLAILAADFRSREANPDLRIETKRSRQAEVEVDKEPGAEKMEEKPKHIKVRMYKRPPEASGKQDLAPKVRSENQSAPLIKPVSSHVGSRGRSLLANGHTPTFEGGLNLTFYQYIRRVHLAGGMLVAYDRTENRIVGRIRGSKFYRDVDMQGFAVRAKDVTEDIPRKTLDAYLAMVRETLGPSGYRFLVIIPTTREAQFVGTLDAILEQAGLRMGDVDLIRYRYHLKGSQLVVRVETVIMDGRSQPVMRDALLWTER